MNLNEFEYHYYIEIKDGTIQKVVVILRIFIPVFQMTKNRQD